MSATLATFADLLRPGTAYSVTVFLHDSCLPSSQKKGISVQPPKYLESCQKHSKGSMPFSQLTTDQPGACELQRKMLPIAWQGQDKEQASGWPAKG